MKDWNDILSLAEDFEWDEGNIRKNWSELQKKEIQQPARAIEHIKQRLREILSQLR